MSLSDCEKCWDTPCTCGYKYESWSPQELQAHIIMLHGVLTNMVREKARQLWEAAGHPSGRDDEFWFAAKKVLHVS